MFAKPTPIGFVCRSCRQSLQRLRQQSPSHNLTLPSRRLHSQKPHSKRQLLPDTPARTRFAPSPTGYLHLGSLRTALFNYLLAKRTGGQFLLRIEDTDSKRTIPDAEKRLYDDLRWAGLEWDEGPEVGGPHGPYRQSERTALYQEHAEKLLESGHAYRCFCSAERLHDLAAQRAKLGLPTDYDRTCAALPKDQAEERADKGEAFVVRLKAPDTYPEFTDIIYGTVGKAKVKSNKHLDYAYDDPILLKSDGLPTYHLANVVDDHHMQITHVIRGTEWMIATPKHLALYEAFGWKAPAFAHVGLLQNMQGAKLSKRNGDDDIQSLRDRGILPEALVNFVALLGWAGNPGGREFMSMEELKSRFNLKCTKGNATVDMGKLDFLQKQHAKALIAEGGEQLVEMADAVVEEVEKTATTDLDDILRGRDLHDYVTALLRIDAKNYSTPAVFAEDNSSMFHAFNPSAETASTALSEAPRGTLEALKQLRYKLESLPMEGWHTNKLHGLVQDCIKTIADTETANANKDASAPVESESASVEDEKAKLASRWATKSVYQCLRAALIDGKHGAPLAEAMEVLGRDECVNVRLRKYFALLEDGRLGLDFTVGDV